MHLRLFFLISFFCLPSIAGPHSVSARRDPKLHWTKARDTYRVLQTGTGAADIATKFSELDLSQVTTWRNLETLEQNFNYLRDLRFLEDPGLGLSFLRRISWLYPDDGCFARAAVMREIIEQRGEKLPSRIFIFGNLDVKTDNAVEGHVTWWYHTAPVVRVDEVFYVIDPALDPHKPLPLVSWAQMQTQIERADFAICSPYAYTPDSDCLAAQKGDDDYAKSQLETYLMLEWTRQVELGRSPESVLGNHPPWQR